MANGNDPTKERRRREEEERRRREARLARSLTGPFRQETPETGFLERYDLEGDVQRRRDALPEHVRQERLEAAMRLPSRGPVVTPAGADRVLSRESLSSPPPAMGPVQPMQAPPGLPASLVEALRGAPGGPTTAAEAAPRPRPTPLRPEAPEPHLSSQALALPFRALRPVAEPIGRALGATPEQERAIEGFVHELGEPQPNPLSEATLSLARRHLSPEAQDRVGRIAMELSGVPFLARAGEAASAVGGMAPDAITRPIREGIANYGARVALASQHMHPALRRAGAAFAAETFAGAGRTPEELAAYYPDGLPETSELDHLVGEIFDPTTFIPGGLGANMIANALSSAARPYGFDDESSAAGRALMGAGVTPAFMAGLRGAGEGLRLGARGVGAAAGAAGRAVGPVAEQAARLGADAMSRAELDRLVAEGIGELADLSALARERGNEAAAQALDREAVRLAAEGPGPNRLGEALLAGRTAGGVLSAAGTGLAGGALLTRGGGQDEGGRDEALGDDEATPLLAMALAGLPSARRLRNEQVSGLLGYINTRLATASPERLAELQRARATLEAVAAERQIPVPEIGGPERELGVRPVGFTGEQIGVTGPIERMDVDQLSALWREPGTMEDDNQLARLAQELERRLGYDETTPRRRSLEEFGEMLQSPERERELALPWPRPLDWDEVSRLPAGERKERLSRFVQQALQKLQDTPRNRYQGRDMVAELEGDLASARKPVSPVFRRAVRQMDTDDLRRVYEIANRRMASAEGRGSRYGRESLHSALLEEIKRRLPNYRVKIESEPPEARAASWRLAVERGLQLLESESPEEALRRQNEEAALERLFGTLERPDPTSWREALGQVGPQGLRELFGRLQESPNEQALTSLLGELRRRIPNWATDVRITRDLAPEQRLDLLTRTIEDGLSRLDGGEGGSPAPWALGLAGAGAAGALAGQQGEGEEGEFPALAGILAAMGTPGSPRFFSRLQRRIEEGPRRGTVQQWAKHLQQGTSKAEREWTGVEQMLSRMGPNAMLTKDELLNVFRRGRIKVDEKVLGLPEDQPGYAEADRRRREARDRASATSRTLTEAMERAGYDDETIRRWRHSPPPSPLAPLPRERQVLEGTLRNEVVDRVRREDYLGHDGIVEAVHAVREEPDLRRVYPDVSDELARLAAEWRRVIRENMEIQKDRSRIPQEVRDALETHRQAEREMRRAASEFERLLEAGRAEYGKWTESGGERYREVLLTLDDDSPVVPLDPEDLVDDERELMWMDDDQVEEILGDALSGRNAFRQHHWPDVPNLLAHVRLKDRRTVDGKRVLYVEEVQSDWAQKGRERGFESDPLDTAGWTAREGEGDPASGPIWEVRDETGRWILGVPRSSVSSPEEAIRRAALRSWRSPQGDRVPDMPFKRTDDWLGLVMKRVIDEAAKEGYDAVAWAPGRVHSDRYNLRRSVSRIEYDPDHEYLVAYNHNGEEVLNEGVPRRELGDYIGRDAARRLLASPRSRDLELLTADEWVNRYDPAGRRLSRSDEYVVVDRAGHGIEFVAAAETLEAAEAALERAAREGPARHVLEGEDLEVGGEGMIAFYDQILPQWVRKYARKQGLDIQLEEILVEGTGDTRSRWEGPELAVEDLDRALTFLDGPEADERLAAPDRTYEVLQAAMEWVYKGGFSPEEALAEAMDDLRMNWGVPTYDAVAASLGELLGGRIAPEVPPRPRPGFQVTPGLRQAVSQGQPLLGAAGALAGYQAIRQSRGARDEEDEARGQTPGYETEALAASAAPIALAVARGRADVTRLDAVQLRQAVELLRRGGNQLRTQNPELAGRWTQALGAMEAELERRGLDPTSPREGETIVEAAYRLPDGRVRTGAAHFEINLPRGVEDAEAGFVTNTGRFVGRQEALEIARAARQRRKNYHPESRPMMDAIEAERGLMAESLYPDPNFARRRKEEVGEDAFVSSRDREDPQSFGGGAAGLLAGGAALAGRGREGALSRLAAPRITVEGMPSPSVAARRLPGIMEAPFELRESYGLERLSVAHREAVAPLLRALGLDAPEPSVSAGTYRDAANAIHAAEVPATFPDGRPVPPQVADLVASVYGYAAEQNAVPWLSLVPGLGRAEVSRFMDLTGDALQRELDAAGLGDTHGAAVFHLTRPLTGPEMDQLARALDAGMQRRGVAEIGATQVGDAIIFGNFTKWSDNELSDRAFAQLLADALDELPEEVRAAIDPNASLGRTRGNYLDGDWGETNGEHWKVYAREAAESLRAAGVEARELELLRTDEGLAAYFGDIRRRTDAPFAEIDRRYAGRIGGAAAAGGLAGLALAGQEGEAEGVAAATAPWLFTRPLSRAARALPRGDVTMARELGRWLGTSLDPFTSRGILGQFRAIDANSLVQALIRHRGVLDPQGAPDVDAILRRMESGDFADALFADATGDWSGRISGPEPAHRFGTDWDAAARAGYPVDAPGQPAPLEVDPGRAIYSGPKPGGVTPGAFMEDPDTGGRAVLKAADMFQNPRGEAFVDQLSRELFGGLVPSYESRVLEGDAARSLVRQVPGQDPALGAMDAIARKDLPFYMRPFLPLREVVDPLDPGTGDRTFAFPKNPSPVEAALALRGGLLARTTGNADVHFENLPAWEGGYAGLMDSGLALTPAGFSMDGDALFKTSGGYAGRPAADLLQDIVTGKQESYPFLDLNAVDVRAALEPMATRVMQLDGPRYNEIIREAQAAIQEWTRLFRLRGFDGVVWVRDQFEMRLRTMPEIVQKIADTVDEARAYPPNSKERHNLYSALRKDVLYSMPVLAALALSPAFMSDEELWQADRAGMTALIGSMLPKRLRTRFLKGVQDRVETPADRLLGHIDYGSQPAGPREALDYQMLRAYTMSLDRLAPIATVTEQAARALGYMEPRRSAWSRLIRGPEEGRDRLPIEMDAETLARAAAGWQGYAAEIMERGVHLPGDVGVRHTRGLNQILAEVGRMGPVQIGPGRYPAHQVLDAYRAAKRAIELADENRPGGAKETGFDLEAAEELVATIERDHPEIAALQRELVDYHDAWMRLLESEGVLKPGALEQMKEAGNREYMPLFRSGFERTGPTVGGKRLGDLPDPVKRLVGSERAVLPPSESDIRLTYSYANLLMRQQASNALAEIAEAWEDNPWIRKVRKPVANVKFAKDQLKGQIDDDLLEMIEPDILSVWMGRKPTAGSHTIAVTREGKRAYYQLDPLLYDAVMGLAPQQMGLLTRLLSAPAQWLRTGVTIMPDFALANLIRDTVQVAATSDTKGPVPMAMARAVGDMLRGLAVIMSASTPSAGGRALKAGAAGAVFGALAPSGLAEAENESQIRALGGAAGGAVGAAFGAGARQIARGLTPRARARPTSRMKPEDILGSWRSGGGDFAAHLSMDRDALAESIRRARRQGQRFPVAWTPAEAVRVLQGLNEAMENANRVGEYLRQLDEMGALTPGAVARAAVESRDASVDFKRHGLSRAVEILRPMAAFWNARIQGVDKIRRAFEKNPRRTSAVLMASVTMPSIGLWLLNRENPDYWELPLWQRNTFWMVPVGRTTLDDGTEQTVFLRVPKPFELGLLFGSLPERMIEAFDPLNPHRGGAAQIEDQAWEQFVGEMAGMFAPIPTAVQPWAEMWMNRDIFTGRPIHSYFEPEDMDARLKGRDRASETARLFSEVLGGAADAMDSTPVVRQLAEYLRLSPAEVDHVFASYLGGAGRLASDAAGALLRDEERRGPAPAGQIGDAPFTGRFLARVPPSYSESQARLGELWREAQGLQATVDRWIEAGELDRARAAIEDNLALFSAYETLAQGAQHISKMRQAERAIEENPGMSAEEKRRALDVIYRINARVAETTLGAYRMQEDALKQQGMIRR